MPATIAGTARGLRPPAGWAAALFALVAVCAPAVAAADAQLHLAADTLWWTGVAGLAIGMGLAGSGPAAEERTPAGRPRTDARRPASDQRRGAGLRGPVAIGRWASIVRHALVLVALAALGALLVLAAGSALPPLGLIAQDAAGLGAWLAPLARRGLPGAPPALQSMAFLALGAARLWQELLIAADAGERGARLLVSLIGVALTWPGALALGYGLVRGRQPLAWCAPLLAALAFTAVLGGAGGTALGIGIAALALAAVAAAQLRRRAGWEASGTDYSDEIGRDVLGWGLGLVAVALLAAWLVPLWPGNPIARLFDAQELPSGLAALQRGLDAPGGDEGARVGLSSLPSVRLGESLEQGPPGQLALRIRTGAPLPAGPAPRYWRVRLLNLYSGGDWSSDAHVSAQPAMPFGAAAPAGLVQQQVEDLRRDQQLAVGLADLIGVDQPASAERLADGSLAALTLAPTERYQALSRPMELAAPPPQDREQPDMRAYLGLPPSVTPRVRDLASIVSGSDPRIPAGQRALLLERYLRELPYAYQVQPLPNGGDAVDQFLFEMRQGYCTYYASAMAVMARSIGIPARVAVGYATGDYDPASGTYTIREAEAHAWPELFIDGRWTIYEPTPVRPLPARASAPNPALVVVDEQRADAAAPDRLSGPLVWAGVLALVALATAAGLLVGRPRPQPTPAARAQAELERFGARAGVPWPAGATLHEYGALLAPHAGRASDALRELVGLVELARYGGRALAPDQEQRLTAAGDRLQAEARASRQGR